MNRFLAEVPYLHLVVDAHLNLLRRLHAQHADELICRHQLRLEIRLLEVLERPIRPAHRLPQLDVAFPIPLARAFPGILVGVLSGNAAFVLLDPIFRLIYRYNTLVVEYFAPRRHQSFADRAENFDHGEIHGLGHVLRGRRAVCGHLKVEGLGLPGDGCTDHRLANAVLVGGTDNPIVELCP